MTSALIIGKHSLIGGALYAKLQKNNISVSATTRETLDLANPTIWRLPRADIAYLCAAITKLNTCERDPAATRRINVEGISALARQLSEAGTFVVFLSSNQVFDGTKPHRRAADVPCPINEYGRQKAEAEQAVLSAGGAVLRLTKVIAPGDARILEWKTRLTAGQTIAASDDLYLAPVTMDQVTTALAAIGTSHKSGIYQLSGPEDCSYFDLAVQLATHLHLPTDRITPGKTAAHIPKNFRPRYSSLTLCLPKPVTVPGKEKIVAYALSTSNE